MVEGLSRIIELEIAELICIEHALSPSQAVTGSNEAGAAGPGKETCLKIGTAILEALGNRSRPVGISFTDDELWLMRERVSIYTSQGANADLGLVIKAKLYQALLSIGNTRAAQAALGGVVTDEEPDGAEMSREEVDDAVRRWKRSDQPNTGPGA